MDMDTDKHIDIDMDNLTTQRFKEIKKKLASVDRILENCSEVLMSYLNLKLSFVPFSPNLGGYKK